MPHFTRFTRAPLGRSARRLCAALTVCGLALSLAGLLFPGLLIVQAKQTHSVPLNLGLAFRPPATWRHGDLVQFLTPDLSPYVPAGSRFVKSVAAVPGDRLSRLGRDFYVNGRHVATARPTDSKGRPAPLFSPTPVLLSLSADPALHESICRASSRPVMPSGTLFVLGDHERSYDSRYWGFVPSDRVIGRVVKIF